jgi:hypothetical protein
VSLFVNLESHKKMPPNRDSKPSCRPRRRRSTQVRQYTASQESPSSVASPPEPTDYPVEYPSLFLTYPNLVILKEEPQLLVR